MTAASRRLFGALALAAIGIGVTVSNPMTAHLHVVTAYAASGWLDRLNGWRAASAVSNLTENTTWSQGDAAHALYMVKDDLVTHYETVGKPYYTVAGDTAAQNSNIFVSSSTSTTDEQSIDWWMGAPFHAMGLMDPRLTQTGFGSYREVKSGWDMGAAVDVLRGNSFTGGTFPVYFPGNGSTEPLTSYSGNEFPDPLQACPGYSMPTGLPVFIELGGNVATTAGPVHSFTGNGSPLEHCVIDSTNSAVGSSLTGRGGVIVIPRQPLQTGVRYVVSLTVNGSPYTWSFTVGALSAFNPFACTSMSASTTPASPAAVSTSVTISGAAVGCPNPRYRFWILPPGGPWQMIQDYNPTASFVWTAPPTPGVYHVEVDARDQTSVTSYDAASTLLYTLTGCTSASMSPNVASPQPPAGTVTFTATSTGCAAPEYKFFLQAPGGSWTAQTSYGGATWAWNTAGLAPGTYGVGVWVHSIGSAASYEAYWIGTYTLATAPCTATSISTPTASPQSAGASVTFAAAGCPGAQFRFWLQPQGGSWTMKRDYGAGSWTWNTTGLAAGTYEVGAWARQPGSTSTYDAYAFTSFVVGAGSCTSASLSSNVATPQAPGATVVFTAGSNGCAGPQYQFWLMPPGGSWTLKQPFSTMTTWSWNTSGMAPGTYQVGVWAKAGTSTASYDAYFIGTYTLDVGGCTSASISAGPASPQVPGTAITFTASSTGCASAQYEFWELPPSSSTWQMVQPYGGGTTLVWNSTGASGPYRFGVWARQSGSPNSYDTYAIVTFWITG